jgi:hypothetical protein
MPSKLNHVSQEPEGTAIKDGRPVVTFELAPIVRTELEPDLLVRFTIIPEVDAVTGDAELRLKALAKADAMA